MFDLQRIFCACIRDLCKPGNKIAINNAMMAITTKSSIRVKPFRSRMMFTLLFQRKIMGFAILLLRHDYNTNDRGDAKKKHFYLRFSIAKP
jgi:hypothetical protein